MLVIPVKDGENIDRALKRFKRKFLKTGTLKEVRSRKEYIKKSEKLRVRKQKAVYSENMLRNEFRKFNVAKGTGPPEGWRGGQPAKKRVDAMSRRLEGLPAIRQARRAAVQARYSR